MISSQTGYREIELLLFLLGWESFPDTPFSAGQMSSGDYVNHRGGQEVGEGIAAVQGTANVIFCVWEREERDLVWKSHTLF